MSGRTFADAGALVDALLDAHPDAFDGAPVGGGWSPSADGETPVLLILVPGRPPQGLPATFRGYRLRVTKVHPPR